VLDSKEIKDDGQAIALGDAPVELTWEIDSSTADVYVVTLFDVTDNPPVRTHSWTTTERRIIIDPTTIQSGRTYVFDVTAQVGVPNAASGDFETQTYPHSASSGESPTFIVE